jgi:hypothetical protein
VAACEDHAPSGDPIPTAGPEIVVQVRQAGSTRTEVKRQRDRERRQAQRIVLDRHADEVQAELDRIRSEGDR